MGGVPFDATVPPPPPPSSDGWTTIHYDTSSMLGAKPTMVMYKMRDEVPLSETYTTISETEKLKKLVMCLVEALPSEHKKVFFEKWKGE